MMHIEFGTIPVLLLSLHDGDKDLPCPKKRSNVYNRPSFVNENDYNTRKITHLVAKNMRENGYKPYVLCNNIKRRYIDLNRELKFSCVNACIHCINSYKLFHLKLFEMVSIILTKYGRCLLFDIHGNKMPTDMLQFGYSCNLSELKRNNYENFSFPKTDPVAFFNGKKSLSYYYKKYFTNIFPPYGVDIKSLEIEKYYSGKKFTGKKYKNICDYVIVEMSKKIRDDPELTALKLSKGLLNFLDRVYLV